MDNMKVSSMLYSVEYRVGTGRNVGVYLELESTWSVEGSGEAHELLGDLECTRDEAKGRE